MGSLGLFSDVHGNDVALEAVLAELAAAGVDRTVCLGDVVDLGPAPREVIRRLEDAGIACVRGNHDPLDEHPTAPPLAAVEAWTRAQLSSDERRALAELPTSLEVELDGVRILLVHGSPRSDTEPLLATTPDTTLAEWAALRPFDVLAAGHTHLPLTRFSAGRWFVNVGSAGLPFLAPFAGGPPTVLPAADCAIVRVRRTPAGPAVTIEHRRVPFDLAAYRRSLELNGFPDPAGWMRSFVGARAQGDVSA